MEMNGEILKKIHKVSLYILLSFDKFCREHDLIYFLDSGTALGAVRHGGFIPWDDDIDVGMPRKDYERLMQMENKLPEDLFLQTRNTDPLYKRNTAKLRLRGTLFQEKNEASYTENGFFIDIFPFDNISSNKIKARIDGFVIGRLHHLISSWWNGGDGSSNSHRLIVKMFIKKIPESFIERLNEKFLELCRKNETQATGYMTSYYWFMSFNHTYVFESKRLLPVCDILFEGYPVKIMKDSDYYLSKIYGDYMQLPPESERVAHHLKGMIDFGKYV